MSYGVILVLKNIYSYHIVMYYPNIFSREFVNIGVLCGNEKDFKFLFLTDEYIDMINCTYLNQNMKIIKEIIKDLNYEFEKIQSFSHLSNIILYFNNCSFSKEELIASDKDINFVIKDLFHQYIGYKYIREDKKEKRFIIREKVIEEIDSNFSKEIEYTLNDIYFDLVLKNKKTFITYKTIIGSLFNEHDMTRAMSASMNSYNPNNKMIYSYYNSKNELEKNNKKAGTVLSFLQNKFEMETYSFNEEKINFSLKKMLNI